MKRILILMMVLGLSLSGCIKKDESYDDEAYKGLPYYSSLNKTNPVITISVEDVGQIKLQLFPKVAKSTVDNFIKYVQKGSYAGSDFHRIIKDFMIQGGKVSNSGCSIIGEFSGNGIKNDLSHNRGVISMARTNVKNSATSQFFIVHKNSLHLDGSYAGFGGVISGFEVLDKLANVPTYMDSPIESIVIRGMSVKLNGYKVGNANCFK